MPTALLSVEILVGALAVLAVAFLVATYARRRAISRGATLLVTCGWRPHRESAWRLGHLRLGSSRLEWYALLGLTARPKRGWDRAALDLESPRAPLRSDRIDFMPDAAPVACAYGPQHFELALTPAAYTALRSWAEAAPPGSTASVA